MWCHVGWWRCDPWKSTWLFSMCSMIINLSEFHILHLAFIMIYLFCILFRYRTIFSSRTDDLHAGARINVIWESFISMRSKKESLLLRTQLIVLCVNVTLDDISFWSRRYFTIVISRNLKCKMLFDLCKNIDSTILLSVLSQHPVPIYQPMCTNYICACQLIL